MAARRTAHHSEKDPQPWRNVSPLRSSPFLRVSRHRASRPSPKRKRSLAFRQTSLTAGCVATLNSCRSTGATSKVRSPRRSSPVAGKSSASRGSREIRRDSAKATSPSTCAHAPSPARRDRPNHSRSVSSSNSIPAHVPDVRCAPIARRPKPAVAARSPSHTMSGCTVQARIGCDDRDALRARRRRRPLRLRDGSTICTYLSPARKARLFVVVFVPGQARRRPSSAG